MDLPGSILIDVSGETDISFDQDFLEGVGHPVIVCHGPPRATLCPILQSAKKGGGECDKVARAHGIIFQLDLDRPQHRAILKRYQELVSEDVPIRAVVKAGQEEKYAVLLAGVVVWEGGPSAADLDGFSAEVQAYDRIS